jgi:hypothetical protein
MCGCWKIDVGARSGIDGCLMQIERTDRSNVRPSERRREAEVMFRKAGYIVTTSLNVPPAISVNV